MFRLYPKILLGAVLFMSASYSLAVRSNDFTKANTKFTGKLENQESTIDMSKTPNLKNENLEQKKFVSPNDASSLIEKRANFSEDLTADKLSKERYFDYKKEFTVKEYEGKTDSWEHSGKSALLKNKDRNLTKDYSGRIDFEKRNPYQRDVDFIKERYGDMMEQSMQDINKYFFRSSRSSEAGIDVQVAGGELKEEDDGISFFDFLSGNKKISRPRVTIEGPADTGDISQNPKASPTSQAPVSKKTILPPVVKNSNVTSVNYKNQNLRTTEEKTVDIDVGKANTYQMLYLPENMRAGKATIKVQVKEEEF